MKRWLVVLLVVLALIILVSPGIVGRLAEKNIEDGITWTEAESPGVTITTETFERGWFTSEGRHRVVLEGGQFREASEKYAAATGNAKLPSLIIDTRMDHGLLPVTSLGRDEGSLTPGLASTVSSFQVDPGNGETFEIPGALYSNVGLSGASDSRLLLEPGSYDHDGASLQWEGTDLRIQADPAARGRAVAGTIDAISLQGGDIDAGFTSLAITADQSATDYGFNIGSADIALRDLKFTSGDGSVSMARMGIKADSEIDDERVSGQSSFTVSKLTSPTGDVVDVEFQVSIADFDAQSLGVISAALKEVQGAGDPQVAMANLYPSIETDLQTLVRKGMEFNIDELKVSLPQGLVVTAVAIDVEELPADEAFSWPAVLLNMTAAIDLRLPVALFDTLATMSPEAGSLVAMGVLQKDGDDYVMEADYAQGLINVNGAPMPIPIPGM
ncbi:MAG: YdgA family protein [Woeseiaceae bacterium]